MATNDFIGFASNGSANIMSQADYAVAVEQGNGVQPGMASSALANKVWRQGANMAAALGRIAAIRGYDALDNGDLNALQASIENTISIGTFNKIYFSQTSGSYTAPRTGVYRITLKGGGGGGAGAQTDVFATGASGGEGGTLMFYITLQKNQSYPYTIGAGGAGGTSGDSATATGGGEGGTTSFNTTTTIEGGKGGVSLSAGGIGGSGGYAFTIPPNTPHSRIPGSIGGAHIRGISRWVSAPTSGGANTGIFVADNNRRPGCGGAGACGNSNTANPNVTYQAQSGNAGSILIEYAG